MKHRLSATYNRNTGLMLTSTDENNQVTSYEYETDPLRPKKTIYPNGGYVLTEYSDKLITDNADLLPGFVRTTTTLEANKFAQSYSYFNGGGQGIRSASQTPDGWSVSVVEYDKLGRPIKSYNPFYVSTPTGAIPSNTKYYDSIGRLSEAEEKRGDTNALTYKQKFDFDRFGNLYRKNSSNQTSGQENPLPYTPIEESDIDRNTNRFTSQTGTTYNEAGQVVSDNKFRLMNFNYDANGRMVKATKANVPDALSVYDALGNRVATKVNDIWQFVIYDAFGNLVAEYGGITANDEGGVKYVLSDWQGSVRAILNNAGFIQSRTDYQAFGEEIQSGIGLRTAMQGFGGGINTRQGYGLTEKDDSTGLNHTWFRKNENRAGRWTSPDPYNGSASLGNPQSFNRYSYVENQPTNFVDPSGLQIIAFFYQTCTENRGWEDPNYRYTCTWKVYFMDTGGSSGGGIDGGGVGVGRNNDDKQYINCMKAVDKKYSNLEQPSKWADYSLEKRQLIELFDQKYSQNWSLSAVDVGVLIILAKVGGKGGVLLGLIGKVAITAYKDGQINDEWLLRAKHLAERFPKEAEYDEQLRFKEAEQKECEKYLPKD